MSKFGFHSYPYVGGDWDWLQFHLEELGTEIVTTLDVDEAIRLKQAGYEVVWRPFLHYGEGFDLEWLAENTRRFVSGEGKWIQLLNEPELEGHDRYAFPHTWMEAAKTVKNNGGLAGVSFLDVHWMWTFLQALKEQDRASLLDFYCDHSYSLNHPPEWTETHYGMLGFLEYHRLIQAALGKSVPIISTECGARPGDQTDPRFPPVDAEFHKRDTEAAIRMCRTGIMPNGQLLPDWYVGRCHWLIADNRPDGMWREHGWQNNPICQGSIQAAKSNKVYEFKLGFKAFADMIPDVVGEPKENEWHNPDNGDGLQQTSNGLLVWRKVTNTMAFTNGEHTWIYGPHGLQDRANNALLDWEEPRANPVKTIYATSPNETYPFLVTPKGFVLHGTRSGREQSIEAEFAGTVSYAVNGANGLAWNYTIGNSVVAVHVPPVRYGWNARRASMYYVAMEIAQGTVDGAVTDEQVDGIVRAIQHALKAWPDMPLNLVTHAELEKTGQTGVIDGKTDIYPYLAPESDALKQRIMAKLRAAS